MANLWELQNNNLKRMGFHRVVFQAKTFSCHSTPEILTAAFHLPAKELVERAYNCKSLLSLHFPDRLYLKGYRVTPLLFCLLFCLGLCTELHAPVLCKAGSVCLF